ncbi:MAG: GIY-YIG nuclease family protein [Candidatus Saccharibacteria bacterium]
MRKQYFTYILASKPGGVLYTGVTNDLARRSDEHSAGVRQGFTSKYYVHRLVYYEAYDSPEDAIRREKNIKAWKRDWKIELIEGSNPEWRDLSATLLE